MVKEITIKLLVTLKEFNMIKEKLKEKKGIVIHTIIYMGGGYGNITFIRSL